MRAADLISDEIPTLDGTDNAIFAMQLLDEYKMTHLPVVSGSEFLGLISESAVLEIENPEESLASKPKYLQQIFVNGNQHAYDIVRIAAEFKLSAIAIVDDNQHYQGVVSIYCLIRELANFAAMKGPGGIIVLEINRNDYSLAEVSQIVESNDARILSANLTSNPDSTNLELTLKINRDNMDGIIQTFNRYDYKISASFHQSSYEDLLQDRYDELMRYLKI